MADYIQMLIPEGRPDGATHYNPRYSLCWEKKHEGTNKVLVFDHVKKNWGFPINRAGGYPIHRS
ncbi:hypothetical protein [Photobacterium alginatilyticum]|uniref:Uncharacterized protein n=1 Tax=Photobacterium alginatilyticum TaxID=1775171 RepID=A0ABW9YLT7_9GAMM|nr:hypothetical protein [Photobacterium alginatilyticum]NBI54680.1 hypothetical protein [Photobacterium alginatilyticum]